MTTVAPGSDSHFFYSKDEIVDHLLQQVLANSKRKIGTEWEMFFIKPEFFTDPGFFKDPAKRCFTRAEGQRAFAEFVRVFKLSGYQPEYLYEKDSSGDRIIGVNIPTLGTIVPEAGYQFEFSTCVCENSEESQEKNEEAYRAVMEVARRLDLLVVFKGRVPGFAEKTETMERSRSLEWSRYYGNPRFSDLARHTLHETQDGTASVQVTVDAGAENFHEFFQALLLIEPALTYYYANSDRSYVAMRAYGEIIPSQVEPIVSVWKTNNPREALTAIVDRLMEIDVPFLPDPEKPGHYKAEPLVDGRPPTVKQLMENARLSERMLNNIGGFFYTRPALKSFSPALLEIRGVDSQPDAETVAIVAAQVSALLYNDAARRKLLSDYAHLTRADIQKLHRAAISVGKEQAARIMIGGMTMADFVHDIMARSRSEEVTSEDAQYEANAVVSGGRRRFSA